MLADCKGDKRLFRKIKRGSIYRVDLEGSSIRNVKTNKSWANDVQDDEGAAYQKLA